MKNVKEGLLVTQIRVKSLWQEKVAIRDRYYKEALKDRKGIVIAYAGEQMTLSPEDVLSKVVGVSEKPFFDRFSKESHFLMYYLWKPDPTEQIGLFG